MSGGYSLARDPRDEVTLPAGWMAGAGVGLTHSLSAVADVSGQYKTIALVGSDARLSDHTSYEYRFVAALVCHILSR